MRILVIRLSAMGDVIHALPAVASLKHSIPGSTITWVIRPKWSALLEGNPFVDQVVEMDRSVKGVMAAIHRLRQQRFDVVVDFQGLLQSALVAGWAKADKKVGLHRSQARGGPRGAVLFDRGADARAASRGPQPGTGRGGGSLQRITGFSVAGGETGRHVAGRQVCAGVAGGGMGLKAVADGVL